MTRNISKKKISRKVVGLMVVTLLFLTACNLSTKPDVLGDFVWRDGNNNGIQDEGEEGVRNVLVKLLDSEGRQLKTTRTDADGKYGFSGVSGGDYIIEFDAAADYRFSPRDQGNDDSLDSDADPDTGQTAVFSLAEGTANFYFDAGLVLVPGSGDPTPTPTGEPEKTPEDGDEEEPPVEGEEIGREEDEEGDAHVCEVETEAIDSPEADIEKVVVYETDSHWLIMAYFKHSARGDYKLGISLLMADLYSASYGYSSHNDVMAPFKWDSNSNYELDPSESVERVETADGGVVVIAKVKKPASDSKLSTVEVFSFVPAAGSSNWACDELKYTLP